MTSTPYVGACLCGRIRVTLAAPPMSAALCHCIHCQKTSSSAFSMVVIAGAADVTIEGNPSSYADRAEHGGDVERVFCPTCGSPVETASAGTRAGGIRIVKAGLFADQSPFTPGVEVFCVRRQPWLPKLANAAAFERMPPAG